jgi:hypothetical protein
MPYPPGHHAVPDASPSIPHSSWHYSVRRLRHGGWAVERGDAEVGGTFTTCTAALRFLRSDLETVVLTHLQEIH